VVVKINFSSVTRANFRAGYACTSNALISLVGIRSKACFSGKLRARVPNWSVWFGTTYCGAKGRSLGATIDNIIYGATD